MQPKRPTGLRDHKYTTKYHPVVLAQKRIQKALNEDGNNQPHPQQAATKSNRFARFELELGFDCS
jgi:hypothetical protein